MLAINYISRHPKHETGQHTGVFKLPGGLPNNKFDLSISVYYWLMSNECNCLSEPGSSLLTGPEGLSMKERENLRKLKALRRYRRRYGVEALLHRQLRERRQAVTEGGTPQVRLLWSQPEPVIFSSFSGQDDYFTIIHF